MVQRDISQKMFESRSKQQQIIIFAIISLIFTLMLFDRYGKIHIILASPFDEYAWRTYDYLGKEIDVEIV